MQVLADLNASETVEQVAKRPASDFAALDTARSYPLGYQKALWLRIDIVQTSTVVSNQSPLVLDFAQPFLDRVDLYSRDTVGGWTVHSAGDWIANAQWPLPGLSPLLKLHLTQAGSNVFYAKVTSMMPLRINPSIRTLDDSRQHSQNNLLLACFMLGCVSLMTLLGLVLAVTYRNATYAWYAVYTVMTMLAIGSYCGVTGYVFWPHSPNWSDISLMVFTKAAALSQMVFGAYLFRPAFSRLWIPASITKIGIGLLCILPVYATLMLPHEGWPITHFSERMTISSSLIVGGFIVIGVMAIVALRSMRKLSILYMLAFAPLLTTTLMSLASLLGFVPMPWLPLNAPLYALVLEIGIVQIVLQLHARENLSAQVVRRTLNATDPLTGFVSTQAFKGMVSEVWNEAIHHKTDAALVYIEADDAAGHYGVGFGLDDDARKLRVVRLLRSGTRPQDIVAVRNDTTFAIVMPGISFNDGLEVRLSRLIALGLMVDKKDPHSAPIRFRIAASTQKGFHGKLVDLDNQLRDKLSDASIWSKKSICLVWSTEKTVGGLDHIEALWQRAQANAVDAQPSTP